MRAERVLSRADGVLVSCGVRGDELHMSEPRWAAIKRDEARLTATNRDQATRARTPYIVISESLST